MREQALTPPGAGDIRVRALYGAVSRGTEALVLAGRVPPSEYRRMRAPFMAGDFPFPVKYGYATAGRVEAGPAELRGRTVFTLHPHQSLFNFPAGAAVPLPDNVPPQRAVLAANMETALNALWDAAPAPGARIAVVGGGVVGALTAYLCGRLAGRRCHLGRRQSGARRYRRARSGLNSRRPTRRRPIATLVFHASGTAAGLGTARCRSPATRRRCSS